MTPELDRATRVLVVDDDPVVRQSVGLLVRATGATVVADAADGSDAVARAREHRPDVVLMDVRMPGVGGPEATEEILRSLPGMRIIAMTTLGTEEALTRMLGAGALGFLAKDDIFDEIGPAIEAVMRGDALISPKSTAQLIRRFVASTAASDARDARERFGALTQREREVATLVAEGLNNPTIAARMFLSSSTIKTHIEQVQRKLGAANRTQVAIIVDRAGAGPAIA